MMSAFEIRFFFAEVTLNRQNYSYETILDELKIIIVLFFSI